MSNMCQIPMVLTVVALPLSLSRGLTLRNHPRLRNLADVLTGQLIDLLGQSSKSPDLGLLGPWIFLAPVVTLWMDVLNTMLVYHVHNAHTIVFVYNAWIKALSLRTIKPERENNTARVITQLGRDNWGQTQSGSDNRGDWQLEQWNFTW